MDLLGHGFQIVRIPEQFGIAAVGNLMVRNRCKWMIAFAGAERSGSLTCEQVAREHALPQPLPARRLVPGAPWLLFRALAVASLFITGRIPDAR